jgi:hypothetical protein
MSAWKKRALSFACGGALLVCIPAAGDDDDDAPAKSGAPSLNAEQQRAVNLAIAKPQAAQAPERTAALGLVLDPTALLSDEGEQAVAGAAEHTAAAEAARLGALYKAGAGASLKMLEAAQAEEVKARADARSAAARFAQHWGPLAKASSAEREKLLDEVASGRTVLVRADLPGRHIIASTPAKAALEVDGVQVTGRVLGILAQFSELQSAGLLLEVRNPPPGLSAGARVPVSLFGATAKGVLLPRDAILFDENGAYVYKQTGSKDSKQKVAYAPVKVKLIAPYGDGWLVTGVDDDDDIVMRGAGVLWSLQGMGAHAADDDEDED